MSISEEFKWLQALHKTGTLTEAEFEDAKSRILAGTGLEASLVQLRPQSEIARLDQDWAEERKSYLRRTRSGSYRLLNDSHIFTNGMIVNLLLLGLACVGAANPRGTPLVVIGIIGMFAEEGITTFKLIKAKAKTDTYDEAYNAYQQKREVLKARLRRVASNPGIHLFDAERGTTYE